VGRDQSFSFFAIRRQDGQILPWVALLMLSFLGLCGLIIDFGRGLIVRRQLQSATDAAALAAAQQMPDGDYAGSARSFSAHSSGSNAASGYTADAPTITTLCVAFLKSQGLPCSGSAGAHAVQVYQSATVQTWFAGMLGFRSVKISAISTAAMRGSKPLPYNVAIILDTTPSMNNSDSNCGSGATQLTCAEGGVQQLLANLAPSVDNVSLFTFPNVLATETSRDYDCSSSANPTAVPYTFPSTSATSLSTMPYTANWYTPTAYMTYQITGFLSDYRASNDATSLQTTSNLVKAAGGKSGCVGMSTTNENTYYAGAIYAAQAALVAEQRLKPGSQNVIILLSDGNATAKENNPGGSFQAGSNDMVTGAQSTTVATSSGSYPSWYGQCSQGVDAANYAKTYPGDSSNATKFYSIAYGALASSKSANSWTGDPGACSSDRHSYVSHPNISPCAAMQAMASSASTFFSDYYLPGSDSGCQASGPTNTITSLSSIFKTIAYDLTSVRLIPNDSATTTP